MQRAKAFFVVCAGVFLLALAYHLGARSATAQPPGNPIVGFTGGVSLACTENGDVYMPTNMADPNTYGRWTRIGNVFAGSGPTPTKQETWGSVKARYR